MNKMLMVGILSISMGTISACSMWDLVKPSSGLSVDTELIIGDKHQTLDVEIAATHNTADNITQNIDNVDKTTLGLLVISVAAGVVGWMLPVPGFMKRRKNKQGA